MITLKQKITNQEINNNGIEKWSTNFINSLKVQKLL